PSFLVLPTGSTGIAAAPGVIAPLAIGAVLMTMIYAGGHMSGAHARGVPAGAVSCLGRAAILGGATARCRRCGLDRRLRPSGAGESIPCPVCVAFLAEFLFTFALVHVVVNVATADATDRNSYFGLAIGFTVLPGAFAVGQVSGAAFNPAVAIGASIRGLLPWSNLWLYIVAELLGGAAAAFAFKALNPTSRRGTTA